MKKANMIIIGGTIASGKSTLVDGIAKHKGFEPIPELKDGDVVQEIILQKLYEGTRIHKETVQYYFLANRYKQYKDHSNGLITSILDRGIWEDWFFAILLMKDVPKSYEHYKIFWKSTVEKILNVYGYPKAYIYLKINWDNFKERIFSRSREAEVMNFSKNEEYFKDLLEQYTSNFERLLKEWNIEFITIDTTKMSKDEVLTYALSELDKRGI